jgi:cell division protein ZapA
LIDVKRGDIMSVSPKKNRVNVEIFGQEYTIIGDKPIEYILRVAGEVDNLMKLLHKNNPQMPPGKVAVLAALNFADELTKVKDEYKWLLELLEDEKNK